jgi:Flp pilus assembly pilin Flp
MEAQAMKNLIARFVREEAGQDLIEYAILGAFVSLAAYGGANMLGTNLNSWYTSVAGVVSAGGNNTPSF